MLKFRIPTKSSYFSSDTITHSQMVDEIFEYTMKSARIIGGALFDHDYSILNFRLISTFILLIFTTIINIYDIYLFRGNVVRCIFCLLTFSAGVQSYAKLYTFIWLRKNIIELRQAAENFHQNFSSPKSSKIFEEKFMNATHVSFGLSVLYICTFILISIYPIILYFILNERFLHYGIELPFIDWKYSNIGYVLNFVHQMAITTTFFCGSISTLCMIICLVTSGIGQFDVLEILLNELDELAIENKDESKDDEIKAKIKFLTQTHAKLIIFLKKLEKTFAPYYFIDFAALIFQKTVVLFAIIHLNFIPGYLITFISGFQLFLPCALGSVLVSKGDMFYKNIYTVSWHLMSVSDQKSLKFILNYSTKSKGLASGITRLTFSTFLEIYKAIYSYLMLLKNVQ